MEYENSLEPTYRDFQETPLHHHVPPFRFIWSISV